MRAIVLFLFCLGCAWADVHHDPETVAKVDLAKYAGSWYEYARFPNRFQRQCKATKVEYTLNKNNTVKVYNSCKTDQGIDDVVGVARVVDETRAKLKVSFVPIIGRLFAGDYWILALDDNYQYALVGSPNRKFLWILSRRPDLSQDNFDFLVDEAKRQGFDTTKLVITPKWE